MSEYERASALLALLPPYKLQLAIAYLQGLTADCTADQYGNTQRHGEVSHLATISLQVDDTLKRDAEFILDELGLDLNTAITMFVKAIVRENRLPLDLSIDPQNEKGRTSY